MKKLLYLAAILISIAFTACEKETIGEIPDRIDIDYNVCDGLKMAYGTTERFEFTVTPADAVFNYDVDSPDCQIGIYIYDYSGLTYKKSENYKLTDVTLISPEEGRYEASVTDLNKSKDYSDRVVVRISNLKTGKEERHVDSWYPFCIWVEPQTLVQNFSFYKEYNPETVFKSYTSVNISSGEATIASPFISSPNLIASFTALGEAKVYVDGVEQISGVTMNDFSKPVTYTVKSKIEYTFTVQVIHSDLPKVFIKHDDSTPIPSKHEDWKSATITIYNPDWTVSNTEKTGIRGRGNSTWTYPKKPYALKLNKSVGILGMPSHKRWVLLANWMDRTLLRNAVSFNLASRTGLDYTPRGQFVELFINDMHMGNYFLCEHIKVDKNRVNIDELDEDEVDGGYILELDSYFDEEYRFRSEVKDLPYMFKDPDEVNDQQFAFIRDYVDSFENALYDDTRFAKGEYMDYIDVESFVDWWLVMELTGIWEPNHPKSTYMHKDKGGKLTMGPVWDFDWETYMPTTWFRIKDALYYGRLFQDPEFVSLVKERWNTLKPEFETFPQHVRNEAERIRNSEYMNHLMWPITQVVNKDESMSFDDAVDSMIKSYTAKMEWMDTEIGKF